MKGGRSGDAPASRHSNPVEASLNEGVYPVRMPYPSDEQALNFENFQSAAAATNGNSINTAVWWGRGVVD
jgi:hypothetical protein